VAYSKMADGRPAIFVVDADGRNRVQLTHGERDYAPYWSPDGRWIAYFALPGRDVWVVPSAGGEARQLTPGPGSDIPAGWLADGSGVLIYHTGADGQHTLVAPLDGDTLRPLMPVDDPGVWVVLSPDGTRVAYERGSGTEGTVWVRPVTGGPERRVTPDGGGFGMPWFDRTWSPNSKSLLVSDLTAAVHHVSVADVDAATVRQVSDVGDEFLATWSPDGRFVGVMGVVTTGDGARSDVWIVPADGGAATRVTDDPLVEDRIAFSPDGRRLLFTARDVVDELHEVPVDGGEPRVILRIEHYAMSDPRLSPDGTRAVFASDRHGTQDLWTVATAGGAPTLFVETAGRETEQQWSPDGSRIAFSTDQDGVGQVWVKAAASDSAHRIVTWPEHVDLPHWSPDGSAIALRSEHESNSLDIWVVPGTGTPRRITTDAAVQQMAWSRDGQAIYFAGVVGSAGGLYVVPAAGGPAERLGSGPPPTAIAISPQGDAVAYTTMSPAGAVLQVITLDGELRRLTPEGTGGHEHPRWSPSGDRIVVQQFDTNAGALDLWMVNVADGTWRRLTNTPSLSEFSAEWTPDGRHLVFVSRMISQEIVTIPVPDGTPGQR